jgi:transcriptional regulator of aromatic amino acid metabolism
VQPTVIFLKKLIIKISEEIFLPLNVITLTIPPLRDRKDDVLVLGKILS